MTRIRRLTQCESSRGVWGVGSLFAAGLLMSATITACVWAATPSNDNSDTDTNLQKATETASSKNLNPKETDTTAKAETAKNVQRIQLLIQDLSSNNSVVAMTTLVKIGEPAVQPMITTMLDSKKHGEVRGCAAQVLGRIKDPRAIRPLTIALIDDSQPLRLFASQALKEIGKPAFESLLPLFDDPSPHARLGATRAIDQIKGERVTNILIERLGDAHHTVRYAAAQGLRGRTSGKRVVDALIAAIDEPNDAARDQVFTSLCHVKDPRLVEIFLAGLNDPYKVVRWRAATGLGTQKAKAAVEPLLAAFKSDDDDLRSSAARALGKIADIRALKPLIQLARTDPDPSVRETAGLAIGKVEHPNLPDEETAWGEAVEGIQLGLRCTTGRRFYRYGEVIRFEQVIRNRSQRDWKFRVQYGGMTLSHVQDGKTSLFYGHRIFGGGVYLLPRPIEIEVNHTGGINTLSLIVTSPKPRPLPSGLAALRVDFTVPPPKPRLRPSRLPTLRVEAGKYTISTAFGPPLIFPSKKDSKDLDVWRKPLVSSELEIVIRNDKMPHTTR